MSLEQETAELKMDPAQLYREEVITDQRVGTIRRLTPVLVDGGDDASRPIQYIGSAQVLTPAGALPLSFPIEAVMCIARRCTTAWVMGYLPGCSRP